MLGKDPLGKYLVGKYWKTNARPTSTARVFAAPVRLAL